MNISLSDLKTKYLNPSLAEIKVDELPNSPFEKDGLYLIKKSSNGYWPVYKKVQNTRTSTEIKRVEGNTALFAKELLHHLAHVAPKKEDIRISAVTGQINIKGDYSEEIKTFLDQKLLK